MFKFFHIAALSVWCAGLVGLPLLLARHDSADTQAEFARTRLVTHHAYVRIVTPAAVIAIGVGTVLVFLRGVFVPWMFVKLALVGLLVLVHAWVGHVTLKVGEEQGDYQPPPAGLLVGMSLLAMLAVLILVLGKPILGEGLVPAWLLGTQGQPLPLREVPIW
ncbi:CopD family protein [Roseococcus sp. SYP-B2431]|uniref:CopD family protein n=1 Tax=Roseococcus sp. SYP-B2431 TaxID=2496640 RepID=UPI0019801B09|nr:CopD family protein [Roseococcus sp. SYP-B2431]